MRLDKHLESLREVLDEIETALNDPKGLASHQRRLALMLSLGFCELIEIYLHRKGILKPGARIKHDWFRQKRIIEKLEQQVIVSLKDNREINEIVRIAVDLEESRDDLAYGSPLDEESLLKDRINSFLQLKKIIENSVGELYESQ